MRMYVCSPWQYALPSCTHAYGLTPPPGRAANASSAVDAIADAAGRLSQAANQYSSHRAFREKLNELLKAGGATATAVAKDRVLQVCVAMHGLG